MGVSFKWSSANSCRPGPRHKQVLKSEQMRLSHEQSAQKEQIKDNKEKIKLNKQLPYLVANIVEILDMDANDEEEEGANVDLNANRQGKSAVVKTSTRQVCSLAIFNLSSRNYPLISGLILDCVFARYWPRRAREAQAQRPSWSEQGLVSRVGHVACRVRFASKGHGGGREADGGLQ